MSASMFFISKAVVRNLKQAAEPDLQDVSSAHLTEGIAAALGFKTHAALLAAFSGKPTIQVQKPSNMALIVRLRALGYVLPDDLKVLPVFDKTYTPFRTYPLRKKYGIRWMGWRNLMVSAINAGLEQKVFGLSPDEDWWTRARDGEKGYFQFVFDGEVPGIVSVDAIGHGELSLNVILNPKDKSIKPEPFSGFDSGDVCAGAWLERRMGAWIQDGGERFACRRALLPRLTARVIEPSGYADQGSFFL